MNVLVLEQQSLTSTVIDVDIPVCQPAYSEYNIDKQRISNMNNTLPGVKQPHMLTGL